MVTKPPVLPYANAVNDQNTADFSLQELEKILDRQASLFQDRGQSRL